MDRIVVGIDGSDGSGRALAWAVDDARRRGDATVEAVHAWDPPILVGSPAGTVAPVPVPSSYDQAARTVIADAIGTVDTPSVHIEPIVVEGPAGASLCEQAKGAALLVVGSSGHSAMMEALVGSVSRYCAHHAPCPVVLVPHPKK